MVLLVVLMLSSFNTGYATELEKKADSLDSQINSLQAELAQATAEIEETARSIEQQKKDLSESEDDKQQQYDAMKLRIQYMYENGPHVMLQTIVESKSIAALHANIEYAQAIAEYDNDMLKQYKEIYDTVLERDKTLQKKREELAGLQTSLTAKITDAKSTLSTTKDAIKKEKEKATLEAALKEAEKLANVASPVQQGNGSSWANPSPTPQAPAPSSPAPTPPSSGAKPPTGTWAEYTLKEFLRAGVIHWNGYKFTYYSQSVLPGTSLNIPGRHVNASGYVSDGDGYICLAGSAPKGTIYNTPFGYQGKVYDRGTGGNHLDVYIR